MSAALSSIAFASAPLPFVALTGVLGMAVGSFLNVVVYRVPRHESIAFPPSHCPSCEAQIKRRHNVPIVSWLALRGHCAYCKAPISVRYPLIETATGLLCSAIAAGWWPAAILAVVALLWLMAVLALRRADSTGTRFVSIPDTDNTQPLEGAVPCPR